MGSNFADGQCSKLIFVDACDHTHYTKYNNCTYLAGLIFANSRLSTKTTKIGPHENFPLYGKSSDAYSNTGRIRMIICATFLPC